MPRQPVCLTVTPAPFSAALASSSRRTSRAPAAMPHDAKPTVIVVWLMV